MSTRICIVEDCEKPAGRPMCSMHAARWTRHGSTNARKGNTGTLLERYERFVVRGDGCWGWSACTNSLGYGHVAKRYAHRVAYELFIGPIPHGMEVCHRCDNPPCTNPAHLFLGTRAQNAADAASKGRTLRGERNASAKLTAGQVREIREMCTNGWPQRRIARAFGVSQSQVSSIVRGKAWAGI